MKIKKITLAVLGTLALSVSSFAFEQKSVEQLKKLSDFKTVEEFEQYHKAYTQECLDNGFGGTGSIPCFIAEELWDRELNIYYKKAFNKFKPYSQEKLKNSQKKWLENRDLTKELSSMLINDKHSEEGSMYALFKAEERDRLNYPMIKERALILKSWSELSK
jgi:uncharacterized protein YecT (DUF1311 family)